MAWRPTQAGPRNIRELFHWITKQFTDVGELVGETPPDGGYPDPPEDPPPLPSQGSHNHYLDNLINVQTGSKESTDALVWNGSHWVPDRRTKVYFQADEPTESQAGDIWFAEGYE